MDTDEQSISHMHVVRNHVLNTTDSQLKYRIYCETEGSHTIVLNPIDGVQNGPTNL